MADEWIKDRRIPECGRDPYTGAAVAFGGAAVSEARPPAR